MAAVVIAVLATIGAAVFALSWWDVSRGEPTLPPGYAYGGMRFIGVHVHDEDPTFWGPRLVYRRSVLTSDGRDWGKLEYGWYLWPVRRRTLRELPIEPLPP